MNTSQGQSKLGFGRELRIKSAAVFARAFKEGRRLHGGAWTFVVVPNGLEHARLGTAISRRVAGNIVQRNRLKRLLREMFRHAQQELPAVDIIALARAGVGDRNNDENRQTIEELLTKVRAECAVSSSE